MPCRAIADVLLLCHFLALGLFRRRQTNQAEFVVSVTQPSSFIYGMVLFTNMTHVKVRAQALINYLSSFRVIFKLGLLSPWGLSHRGTVPLLCPIHCRSSRQSLQYQMTFLVLRTWSPVNSGLVKHIPRSARPACASHLAGLLRVAASHPEVSDNWLSIFDWSGSILIPLRRGGKRHNLASTIKKRICSFSHSSQSVEPAVAPSYKRLSDDAILAQAVAARMLPSSNLAAIA